MDELDMSLSGNELFPEAQGVTQEPFAEVPQTGVTDEAAAQSTKEMNFAAIREELGKLKEEREYWKGRADERGSFKQEPAPEPYDPFKSLADDDLVSGSHVRNAFNSLRSEFQNKLAAVETKAQHSDWNNMVTQHVPQLTSKNPLFQEMIQNSSNPYEAAYLLAEMNARQSQGHQSPVQTSEYGQRALTNAQKPQSLASVGGSATLSKADYYAKMSDKDFMEMAGRHMAEI